MGIRRFDGLTADKIKAVDYKRLVYLMDKELKGGIRVFGR